MSFQDIGRNGASSSRRSTNRMGNVHGVNMRSGPGMDGALASNGADNMATINEAGVGAGDYTSVSQGILQYQQNVGILSNIIKSIGTDEDGPLLKQQFKVQSDVISQIGSKIENQLSQQETLMESMTRTDASKSRATHVKLTRDYRWVETKFKNIQLENKQRRNVLEAQRIAEMEERNRRQFEQGIDSNNAQLQMQLQDQRVTEEIMREREEEVRKINQGMHQVNEIYKDLANIVSYQQDQVDEVEAHMENANKNAESGLQQIEKASAKSDSTCVIS